MKQTKKKFGVKIDGTLAERVSAVKETSDLTGEKQSHAAIVRRATSIGLPKLEKELKHGKAI